MVESLIVPKFLLFGFELLVLTVVEKLTGLDGGQYVVDQVSEVDGR